MSHFTEAFNQLSSADQIILKGKIIEWGKIDGWKSQRVVANFSEEHFLPIIHMKEILEFIISKKDSEMAEIISEMRGLFHRIYLLKGETIRVNPYPENIGFAIPVSEFKDTLMRLYGKECFGYDESEIDKFINSFANGIVDSIFSDCLFKDDYKIVWLTWDKFVENNPFCFLKFNKAEEIAITLGLDERYFTPPLLLSIFNVSEVDDDNFGLFRPTFCDSGFYENWRPTPDSFKDYGLTEPLVDTISDNGSSYKPERRPETVVRSKHIKVSRIVKVLYINR